MTNKQLQILALDLGTTTGWAANDPRGADAGVECFKPAKGDSSGIKFHLFRSWLERKMLSGFKIVAYEIVHPRTHSSSAAIMTYNGFLGVLQEVCEAHKVEYKGIPVQHIKQTATGRGNAGKDAMVERCVARLGVVPATPDEADARWLLYHMREVLKIQ